MNSADVAWPPFCFGIEKRQPPIRPLMQLSTVPSNVEIGNAAVMRVEILVPEREADVIQVGKAITLKVDSYPLKAFEGEVVFIAPAVEERIGGQRIVRVDARVDND